MRFIVFSDDWGEHPSSCQHLFRQIARQHPVLWVNTVGMRTPRLNARDLRKGVRKLSRMMLDRDAAPPLATTPSNLRVVQPPMLPLPNWAAARTFNDWSALRSIRHAVSSPDIDKSVVVTTVPNACGVVDQLYPSPVVYYCVDDFAQWPGLAHDAVRRMESRLVDRADLLVATSAALQRRLSATGRPVHLLTHGVDAEHFFRDAMPHPLMERFPSPRAGFFGLVDERLDEELIHALAVRMPAWVFVFAGPRVVYHARLAALPNVQFVGPLAYSELPAFAASMDALVLPYRVNDFTKTLAPLKLLEYLATLRPVICSRLPEACLRIPLVTVAESIDGWVDALSAGQWPTREDQSANVEAALAGQTWAHKAAELLGWIGSVGVRGPVAGARNDRETPSTLEGA